MGAAKRMRNLAEPFCAPGAQIACSSVAIATAARFTASVVVPELRDGLLNARPVGATSRAGMVGSLTPNGTVGTALGERS